MNLNYDCVREILLNIESEPLNKPTYSESVYEKVGQGKYSKDEVLYAIKNMIEANLLSGTVLKAESGTMIIGAVVIDITYEGHEYLKKVRDPKAWAYAKKKAAEVGDFSLKALGIFAYQYFKGEL